MADAKLKALEARLRALEDERAIMHLMAAYGPAVDSGSTEAAAWLWTEDGVYDAQVDLFEGRAGIRRLVTGPMHQEIIKGGSAHVIGMPLIELDGDRAVATCYARLYRWGGDAFKVARITANRWQFVREADGWHIKHRLNIQLNGAQEARDLLGQGVKNIGKRTSAKKKTAAPKKAAAKKKAVKGRR